MPTPSNCTTTFLVFALVMSANAKPVAAQAEPREKRMVAIAHVGEHTTIKRATYPDFSTSGESARTTVSARGNVRLELFVRLDAPVNGVLEVMDAAGTFRPLRLSELVLVSTQPAGAHEVSVTWRSEDHIAAVAPTISYLIAPARDAATAIASR